jgi:hypothetical protein
VPANAIDDHMLSQEEAAKRIRRIKPGIPKRPAGASVRRGEAQTGNVNVMMQLEEAPARMPGLQFGRLILSCD